MTHTLFLTLFSYLLLSGLDAMAQQSREMQPLEIHDFECLQSLECIQSSQSLKRKGWSFIFDDTVDEFAPELTARMEGENISFLATYDKQGNMIKSKYERVNMALPRCLLTYLTQDNYQGWKIAGSEMQMKDFDPASVKYTVRLENETSMKSEAFDAEFINELHLKHEGLAQYCPH